MKFIANWKVNQLDTTGYYSLSAPIFTECKRELMLGGAGVLCTFFPMLNFIVRFVNNVSSQSNILSVLLSRKCSQLPASICQLCWKIILHGNFI